MSKINIANSTEIFYDTNGLPSASGGVTTFDENKKIPRITAISGPNRTAEEIDITAFDSDGVERDYLIGRVDPGEISITVQYSPAQAAHKWLEDRNNSFGARGIGTATPDYFTVRYVANSTGPEHATKSFKAYVSGFEFSADQDTPLTATITLKVTGPTQLNYPDTRNVV